MAGVEALKANRKDQLANHQAEIKRLRAKIGQLVMDDENRQEAMRSFSSGRSDVERVIAKGKGPHSRICLLLNVARSAPYYRNRDRTVMVDEVLTLRIKQMIDAGPCLRFRMICMRLRMQNFACNRNAVQRSIHMKGWQCYFRFKKRCSPRVESSVTIVAISNVRCATDATYIWTRWRAGPEIGLGSEVRLLY